MDDRINAQRFTGFAGVYEDARPAMPDYPAKVIIRYLGHPPGLVVDLGCGTGLSTVVWERFAQRVVGVEPSEDMLAVARGKESEKISFVRAFSHATGLEDGCADAVVCSQSFHWMEPGATLAEVDRILKPGGVFATVDCDWPPVSAWRADCAYEELCGKMKELEAAIPEVRESFVRFPKERHLQNIRESGYFRFAREVVFANTEACTAGRYIAILASQGSFQSIMKARPGVLKDDLRTFEQTVRDVFGDESFEIDFSYRMRLGVK